MRGLHPGLIFAALLAVAAPLPFGGTPPTAIAVLGALAALGLVVALLGRRGGALPPARFVVLAVLTLLLGLAYLVPVPTSLGGQLSPRLAAEWHASLAAPGEDPALAAAEAELLALAGDEREVPTWRPLAADADAALAALARWGLAVAAFLLALLAVRSRGERRLLAGAIGLSAFVQASYGLAESLSGHHHIFDFAKVHYLPLATGTFISPNHFAALLSLGLFALAGLLLSPPDDEPPDDADASGRWARLALLGTCVGLLVVAMAWSSSRAALAAAAIALIVMLALVSAAAWRTRAGRTAAVGVLVVASVLVAGSIWIRPPAPLADDIGDVSLDMTGRQGIWRTTGAMIADFPLVGAGPGAFPILHPLYRPPELSARIQHAHSDYLEWVLETGPAGAALLVAWLAVLGLGAAGVLRQGRDRALTAALMAGLLALAIHETVEFALQLPGVSVPAALLAGALFAPLGWGPRRAAARRSRRAVSTGGAMLVAALAAAAAAGLAVTGRPVPTGVAASPPSGGFRQAEVLRRWARAEIGQALTEAREAGAPVPPAVQQRFARAVRVLREAAGRAPLRGDIQLTSWLGAQSLVSSRLPAPPPPGFEALSPHYLRRAEQLAPSSRARRLVLARYWLAAGAAGEAHRVLRDLLEDEPGLADEAYALLGDDASLPELMAATPNRPDSALRLATALRRRGDHAGAQLVLDRALSRTPAHDRLRRALGRVLVDRGRAEEGLAVFADAKPTDPEEKLRLLRERGRALARLGREDELADVVDELAAAGEEPDRLALQRARLLLARGEGPAAIEALEQALRQSGRLPPRRRLDLLLALGRAQEAEGRFREALESYREAERIDPEHAQVRRFFEQLDRSTGSAG